MKGQMRFPGINPPEFPECQHIIEKSLYEVGKHMEDIE